MLDLIAKHDIHIETKVSGLLRILLIGQTYPFEQVNEMLADGKTGKTDGRLVLTF